MILRRLVFVIALIAATSVQALAIPGQTEKQLVVWGKANPVLAQFKRTFDQNTAGNDYVAHVTISGYHVDFSSEPSGGTVPREYLSFNDVPAKWDLSKTWPFNAKAFGVVYGAAVAQDVLHPVNGFATHDLSIRQGKLFTYAGYGSAIMIFPRNAYAQVVNQAKSCDAIDCAGD